MQHIIVATVISVFLNIFIWQPIKASTVCHSFNEEWVEIQHHTQNVLLERGGTIVFQYEDKDGFVDHTVADEYFVIPEWMTKVRLLDSSKDQVIICHIG